MMAVMSVAAHLSKNTGASVVSCSTTILPLPPATAMWCTPPRLDGLLRHVARVRRELHVAAARQCALHAVPHVHLRGGEAGGFQWALAQEWGEGKLYRLAYIG